MWSSFIHLLTFLCSQKTKVLNKLFPLNMVDIFANIHESEITYPNQSLIQIPLLLLRVTLASLQSCETLPRYQGIHVQSLYEPSWQNSITVYIYNWLTCKRRGCISFCFTSSSYTRCTQCPNSRKNAAGYSLILAYIVCWALTAINGKDSAACYDPRTQNLYIA